MKNHLIKKFRDNFVAGLLAIIPIVITIWVIKLVLALITSIAPFKTTIPGIRSLISILVILLIGLTVKNVFGRRLLKSIEDLLLKIPLVSHIYHASKEVVNVFSQGGQPSSFQRVVLIEYPRKGMYSLGFITKENATWADIPGETDLVNVFLPTSPNPTTGYFALIPRKDIISVNLSLEQGLKLIISGGIVVPGDKK